MSAPSLSHDRPADDAMISVHFDEDIRCWQLSAAPPGPAGACTLRLPFGVEVRTDRLTPARLVDVLIAEDSATGAVDPDALQLLEAIVGRSGRVAVEQGQTTTIPLDAHAAMRRRAACRLALLNAKYSDETSDDDATAESKAQRAPALWAAEAALEAVRVDGVLEAYARSLAKRGAEALRLLPADLIRGEPTIQHRIAELVRVARSLLGDRADLGPLAETLAPSPDASDDEDKLFQELAEQWSHLSDELVPVVSEALRGVTLPSRRATASGTLPVTDMYLPTGLLRGPLAWSWDRDGGRFELRGTLRVAGLAPRLWARAFHPDTGAVFQRGLCQTDGDRLQAVLSIPGHRVLGTDIAVDITFDRYLPPELPGLRRLRVALSHGGRASDLLRLAAALPAHATPAQWQQAGLLLETCADVWEDVGDLDRQGIALAFAASAYEKAGDDFVAQQHHADLEGLRPRLSWAAEHLSGDPDLVGLGPTLTMELVTPLVTRWLHRDIDRLLDLLVVAVEDPADQASPEIHDRALTRAAGLAALGRQFGCHAVTGRLLLAVGEAMLALGRPNAVRVLLDAAPSLLAARLDDEARRCADALAANVKNHPEVESDPDA